MNKDINKEKKKVEEDEKTCCCGHEVEGKENEDKNSGCECKNEYLEMAQRIQAEFDNYRKRSNDILKSIRIDGVIEAVNKFLPALDSIKKAKTMIKDEKVLEGIDLIEKEFNNSLKSLNIEEILAENEIFDPKFHNVVAVKNDNSLDDGIITDVYQAGYKIGDRVLRYSQVVVNKIQKKD